jgi:hypothetical protein
VSKRLPGPSPKGLLTEELEMSGKNSLFFALMALAGGVFLFNIVKKTTDAQTKKQTDDAIVDAMSQQSFPASEAPAY